MTTQAASRELPTRQFPGYHLAGHTMFAGTPDILVLVLPGTEGERMRDEDARFVGIATVRAEDGTDDGSFADLDAMAGKLPGDPAEITEAIASYVRESLTVPEATLLDPSEAGITVRFV